MTSPSNAPSPSNSVSSASTDPSRIAEVNRPDRVRAQIAELRKSTPAAEPAPPVVTVERTAPYDLVFRGRRILTTAGITDREIGIRDGKIVAIEPYGHGLAGHRGDRPRRRRDADPGPGRHPRAHQRARPHRLGGLRHRHQGGRGRRGDHGDRHAAQLDPAPPSTVRRSSSSAWSPRARPTSTSASGAARCRATSNDLRELHDAGAFGFKCFLLHSGVDEFPHLEPDELEEYLRVLRVLRRADDRARRGLPGHRPGPAARG